MGAGEDGEEEIVALKLSSGNGNSEEPAESISQKIMDIASASKETIKKTINKGKEAVKGAADKMGQTSDKRKKGRRKKSETDFEEGEMTLLNADEDDINRLDADEERPF